MTPHRNFAQYGLETEAEVTLVPSTANSEIIDQKAVMEATMAGLNLVKVQEELEENNLQQVVVVLENLSCNIDKMIKTNQGDRHSTIASNAVNIILINNGLDPIDTIGDLTITKEGLTDRIIDVFIKIYELMKKAAVAIRNFFINTYRKIIKSGLFERKYRLDTHVKDTIIRNGKVADKVETSISKDDATNYIYCDKIVAMSDSIRYLDMMISVQRDFLEERKSFNLSWEKEFLELDVDNVSFKGDYINFIYRLNSSPSIRFDRFLEKKDRGTKGLDFYTTKDKYLGFVTIIGKQCNDEIDVNEESIALLLNNHVNKDKIEYYNDDTNRMKPYENKIDGMDDYLHAHSLYDTMNTKLMEFFKQSEAMVSISINPINKQILNKISEINGRYGELRMPLQVMSAIMYCDTRKIYDCNLRLVNYVIQCFDACKYLIRKYETDVLEKIQET